VVKMTSSHTLSHRFSHYNLIRADSPPKTTIIHPASLDTLSRWKGIRVCLSVCYTMQSPFCLSSDENISKKCNRRHIQRQMGRTGCHVCTQLPTLLFSRGYLLNLLNTYCCTLRPCSSSPNQPNHSLSAGLCSIRNRGNY
jgi:hypothetical protein